ncbi:MAG: helicase-related protein [Cyanobacteria bacterium P01_G01_bin.39]
MAESNSDDKSWFAKEIAYERVVRYLSSGKLEIRIATGWFSVAGWNLIRKSIGNKNVRLIVGINEPHKRDVANAKIVIVEEIIRDLSFGIIKNRSEAVQKLVERIESNKFQIVDGRAMPHHAKIYIVDRQVAIFTSANLSKNGLKINVEGGNELFNPDEISRRVQEFDAYFANARNLTQELLEALKKWLEYSSPWEAYLKTLIALEDLNLDKKYIPPADYQLDMIAETLKQIKQHNGSMLVASTGLGKTVVATHVALHLDRSNDITNVLVLCPKLVRKSWDHELYIAGIASKSITYRALDKEEPDLDYNLRDFEELEAVIDRKWLIIIDESHFFRNSKQNAEGYKRRSFQKLLPLIQKSDCKVLLLTGSPYSKSVENLNDQLLLLPHTQPNIHTWTVSKTKDFIDLPVVSQLTTPHVAQHYGQKENDSLFIWFGTKKRYIPSVMLYKLDVPLFLESKVAEILESDFLSVLHPSNSPDAIRHEVQISCASSPGALHQALQKVVNTPSKNKKNSYDVEFKLSQAQRKQYLQPFINELEQIGYKKDTKLLVLIKLLEEIASNKEKTIIFCERRATVAYLVKALNTLLPSLKVFGTIQKKDDAYSTQSISKIQRAILKFAPTANKVKKKSKNTYSVFIATDAYGVGINLQDAAVAINYDLSWTTIEPVQRAGRILRPWIEPRTVKLYSFVPISTNSSFASIINRWQNLMNTHNESTKILDLPVLSMKSEEKIYDLSGIASKIKIRSGKLDIDALATEAVSASYYKKHASTLHKNRNEARQIKGEIISSKLYSGNKILIYVLLKYKDKYHWIVYYPGSKSKASRLENISKEQILNWLQCDRNTEKALINSKKIDRLANECIEAWCNKHNVCPDNVLRECSVYLKPKKPKDKISNLVFE